MVALNWKKHARWLFLAGLSICLSAVAAPAWAQEAAASPAPQPATAPADGTPVEAVVIEVAGRAQHAPAGTEVTNSQAWQTVQLNDRYSAGTLIRTSLSSRVVLQFGTEEPYTVVMVERMTLASIESLYKTGTEKVSRVSLSYGAVRGGVSEGGLRSSFVVDSTVATLTKRGTWGFRLFVERGTGRFVISLAETGLVEALNNLTRDRQNVFLGQYVTQAMIRWVDQTSFDRLITMQDRFGLTSEELQFKAFNQTGLAVLFPADGAGSFLFGRDGWNQFTREQLQERLQNLEERLPPPGPGVIDRPEGDFNGTFR